MCAVCSSAPQRGVAAEGGEGKVIGDHQHAAEKLHESVAKVCMCVHGWYTHLQEEMLLTLKVPGKVKSLNDPLVQGLLAH